MRYRSQFISYWAAEKPKRSNKSLTFDAATVKQASVPMPGAGEAHGGPGAADPGRIHYPNVILQEQLGLKLESSKTAVELLVIDQAERRSEN
jgi:hypothetical protein